MIKIEEQISGGHHDTVESLTFSNDAECKLFFDKLKKVFFHISSWGKLFDDGTEFQLITDHETLKFNAAQVGDFVKIKIPGPKSIEGEGADWVKITEVENDEQPELQKFAIVLSPCSKPGHDATAHFFQSEAKNYFMITKSENTITAEVHGRNEIPNYENLNALDKARNFLVAYKGILGFSKAQWEAWTKNILDNKYLEECVQEIEKFEK